MKPDTRNTWMQAELGQLHADAQVEAEKGGVIENGRTATSALDIVFFFTRFIFGILFACHGAQKLFGLFGAQPMLHDPWMLTAGILELFGGVCIALGVFTRPVAFVLCGEMAAAYFKVHFLGSFWPIENHGELAVVYCFFYLYLSIRGAGAISIDGLRERSFNSKR
jgi:putative oxidoreductase